MLYSSSIVSLTTNPAYVIIFDKNRYPWVNLHTEGGRFDYHVHEKRWADKKLPARVDFFENIIVGEAEDLARR